MSIKEGRGGIQREKEILSRTDSLRKGILKLSFRSSES